MSEIAVKEKDIVVPGDVLAQGMSFLPSFGTYREGDKIFASIVGLVNVEGKVIRIIPLAGGYLPKKGDVVIGKVIDVLMSGWRIDFGSPYQAVLSLQEGSTEYIEKDANLSKYYAIGDLVCTKIVKVTSQNLVDVTMKAPGLKKLYGGRIIQISPHKVPRVIGKQGSMVSLIKQMTGSWVIVGQNGMTWIKNDDLKKEAITVEAVKMIEANSHISGLTDTMKNFLDSKLGDQNVVQ